MKNIFTNIYKFLNNNRWFAYLFIILSFAIFVFFGMKVVFNENIADLLPNTNDNFYGDLAFKDLKVKDKIFLQFVSEDKMLNPEELSDICKTYGNPKTFKLIEMDYRRYKNKIPNNTVGLKEQLYFVERT